LDFVLPFFLLAAGVEASILMTPQFPSSHLPDNQHVKFLCTIQWRIKSHLVEAHEKKKTKREKVPTFAEVNRSNEED
jgi:hypothetical protein